MQPTMLLRESIDTLRLSPITKIALIGHLIRKLDIRLAIGLFCKIRLVQKRSVHADSSVLVDVDIVSRARDIAFDEKLVAVVKAMISPEEKSLVFTLMRISPL